MSWFKKKDVKKGELPELPEMPELPPLPESNSLERPNYSLPALPTFPSSLVGEKISKEVVKQAIKEPQIDEEEEYPFKPEKEILTKEISESISPLSSRLLQPIKTAEYKPKQKEIEPIFIRIDKYEDAISDLREAKKALLEIESHLKDVKETRNKEEAELQRWEEEIKEAKDKLNEIDATIFQKLE